MTDPIVSFKERLRRYELMKLEQYTKKIAAKKKYQRAVIRLARQLSPDYVTISNMGCNDDGETGLYWDIKTHYCDIEPTKDGQRYSIYIRQRSQEEFTNSEKDWFFDLLTLDEFKEPWLVRLLEPFRRPA